MQPNDSVRQELALWVALCNIHGLGNQGVCQLLKAFGEPKSVFDASYSQLRQIVADKIAESISAGPDISSSEATLNWLESAQNHLITLADIDYPKALLEIPDPPPLIYAKGQKKWLNTPGIAIVGSRNASPQGEKNAEDFSQALANHGYTIISGMALGIDGAAHRGALKATGATIAVVGTGLDIVYPSRHRELAHQIVEQGLILSEFPLGTPSRAQNFPRRNRIISGLAMGCLVVEANIQSGSLITARLAAEQGREVFAIPGSIHSPVSKGCHQLIKQGAKLVDNIQDIVDELGAITRVNISTEFQIPLEANPLLDSMGFEPVTMEVLLGRSGLTSDNLSAMLLMLELESKVASLPGGRYQRLA
jgi:DNA processing protein